MNLSIDEFLEWVNRQPEPPEPVVPYDLLGGRLAMETALIEVMLDSGLRTLTVQPPKMLDHLNHRIQIRKPPNRDEVEFILHPPGEPDVGIW